jgi:ubiquinone/menaquinone biosynthesis C-methylase UbiE
MPDHTNRFTGRAEDYNRYRQRYPADAVLDRLRSWCGLTPDWRVADIGAGTGMLAEVFLANGDPVVAVEPNADMRRHMQRRLAATHVTGRRLRIIAATAEATTLPEASVELVGVGRALHWFDRERATAEFRRILVPGGWVTVIALDRRRGSDDPAVAAQLAGFEDLLARSGTDYKHVVGRYRTYENLSGWFDGEVHQAHINGTRELDWENFRGHTLSLSTAPRADSPQFATFEAEMHRYFEAHARNGILTIPVTCCITAARFAGV